MGSYTRLQVSGFRRLANLQLRLGDLTVLVGANGSGKSSVLDALWLCSASAAGQLRSTVQALGGFQSILSKGTGGAVGFALSEEVPEAYSYEYRFSLSESGGYLHVLDESLDGSPPDSSPKMLRIRTGDTFRDAKGNLVRPFELGESLLHQASGSFNIWAEAFRGRLHNTRLLRSPSMGNLRSASPRIGVKRPLPDGRGLAESLEALKKSEPDQFELLLDSLRALFPRFDRIEPVELQNGTLTFAWWDSDYAGSPFYPHQLSDGTLRALLLMTTMYAVYKDERTDLLLVDEPEVSLHPEAIGQLAGFMREASNWTQIVVATHSIDLVRRLEPTEIAAVDIGEGGVSHVRRGDELDLAHWLEDYSMDELWRMGEIGGRP